MDRKLFFRENTKWNCAHGTRTTAIKPKLKTETRKKKQQQQQKTRHTASNDDNITPVHIKYHLNKQDPRMI